MVDGPEVVELGPLPDPSDPEGPEDPDGSGPGPLESASRLGPLELGPPLGPLESLCLVSPPRPL